MARQFDRRIFVKGAAAALALPAFPAVTRAASVELVTSYDVGPREKIRILAVTDLHFFCRTGLHDRRTVRDLHRLVERNRPDLMIVDGDVWHDNPGGKGLEYCAFACEKLSGLGAPWAFVRGNHDQADDWSRCAEMIASAPNSLYPGGEGDYRIEIFAGDYGPAWGIMAVNDAAPERGFNAAAVSRLKGLIDGVADKQAEPMPHFLFCHIPFQAFDDMVERGDAMGRMWEPIKKEGGSPFVMRTLADAGFIKGVFCGHQHLNDCEGTVDGVRLEYVRSTGRGGYGNMRIRKGATLIEAHPATGEFRTVTVFPNGDSWEPKTPAVNWKDKLGW